MLKFILIFAILVTVFVIVFGPEFRIILIRSRKHKIIPSLLHPPHPVRSACSNATFSSFRHRFQLSSCIYRVEGTCVCLFWLFCSVRTFLWNKLFNITILLLFEIWVTHRKGGRNCCSISPSLLTTHSTISTRHYPSIAISIARKKLWNIEK
jgi:hypothetical protein